MRRLPPARVLRRVPAAALAVAVVEVGLRSLPLPRLARLLGVRIDLVTVADPSPVRPLPEGTDRDRMRAIRIVLRRWPWGRRGPCLRHALAAGALLRHRGPRLRLGAARGERGLLAHAWLVVDGSVIDTDPAGWSPLLRTGR